MAATPGRSPGEEARAQAVESLPPLPAASSVESARFELHVTVPESVRVGRAASFDVVLTPLGDHHVNRDYPTNVSVSGSRGLSMPKAKLVKKDAEELTEQRVRFVVPFVAETAGAHDAETRIRFALCSPVDCVPEQRTLSFTITAN